jgi:hypothetical protein
MGLSQVGAFLLSIAIAAGAAWFAQSMHELAKSKSSGCKGEVQTTSQGVIWCVTDYGR